MKTDLWTKFNYQTKLGILNRALIDERRGRIEAEQRVNMLVEALEALMENVYGLSTLDEGVFEQAREAIKWTADNE